MQLYTLASHKTLKQKHNSNPFQSSGFISKIRRSNDLKSNQLQTLNIGTPLFFKKKREKERHLVTLSGHAVGGGGVIGDKNFEHVTHSYLLILIQIGKKYDIRAKNVNDNNSINRIWK